MIIKKIIRLKKSKLLAKCKQIQSDCRCQARKNSTFGFAVYSYFLFLSYPAISSEVFQQPAGYSFHAQQGIVVDSQVDKQDIFIESFQRAKANDPAYQTALAEFDVARLQATASYFAYAPNLRYSESVLEFESQSRKTTTISQPVFSVDKIATFREGDTRAALAVSNLLLREYDLLARLTNVTADFVKACESLRTNQARISTLEGEADKAKKEYVLGQGTITDLRDTEVRLDQARATQHSLLAKKTSAMRAFRAMTGELPDEDKFVLSRHVKNIKLPALQEIQQQALSSNADLINSKSQLHLAQLGYFRAKGSFLPEVNYQVTQSKTNLSSNNSSGLFVNIPLQANTMFNLMSAKQIVEKSQAQVRQVEQQVVLDTERYYTEIQAGLEETNMRLKAIASARLSVQANEKSFSGGVRTRLDILNSVQTEFQVNEDYVTSLSNLVQNWVSLGASTATPASIIAARVQDLFF
jgi:outer membrane protein TolC